jgi:hypothetical protein
MSKSKILIFGILLAILGSFSSGIYAQKKTKTKKTTTTTTTTTKTTNVTDSEISGGLKEALFNGITNAVKSLGQEGGFLNNLRVKIPMPKPLQPIEKALRFAKQEKMADDFVSAMNHAAEKAVTEAIPIFTDSLKQMTLTDARNILFSGEKDSATQFFRRTSEDKLREKFMPVIKKFTDETGATSQYKKMVDKYPLVTQFGGKDKFDLDTYVTNKALDGLFLLIADEEKRIRENPLGRTTDLLRKVFGILKN